MHSEHRGRLPARVGQERSTDDTQGGASHRAVCGAFESRREGFGLGRCWGVVEIWHKLAAADGTAKSASATAAA